MGQTEGAWRLKAMIFCIVMPMILYGVQGFFVGSQIEIETRDWSDYEGIDTYNESSQTEVRSQSIDSGTDIVSVLGTAWEFATFQGVQGTPAWASWFLSLFVLAIMITLAYVVYTFGYEVIKALPFT
jgi:hypothetical protein